MADRDKELDDLQARLHQAGNAPYIERPDEVDVDVGGACFLNQQRVCGPDCTAFVTQHAPTAAERCVLLVVASDGLTAVQSLLKHLQDAARRPPAPSMPPRGHL